MFQQEMSPEVDCHLWDTRYLQSLISALSCSCLSLLFPVRAHSAPQTVEHGFPHQPSALGYSPSLQLLAIGTRSGAIKLYPSPTYGLRVSSRNLNTKRKLCCVPFAVEVPSL